MKKLSIFILVTITGLSALSQANDRPEDTEQWKPVPQPVVGKPLYAEAPPGSLLLSGNEADFRKEWMMVGKQEEPAKWEVANGVITVNKETGNIRTRRSFGSYRLHLEFLIPENISGQGQSRGNSGIFLAASPTEPDKGYEIQVLDSYKNDTYVNGMLGSIYKQFAPLVNASLPPGTWQSYDIVWSAPVFSSKGILISPARVTAWINGMLVQKNVRLKGPTLYAGQPRYKWHGKLPIQLQSHNDPSEPISFRNIWIQPF